VAIPVVLFAGATVIGQVVSPARGQSLLPSLPVPISNVGLGRGESAEVYLYPGHPGVNQLHVILDGLSSGQEASSSVRIRAGRIGSSPTRLRQLTLSPGHVVAYPTLGAGRWRFSVTATVDGHPVAFGITRDVS
jgi:hypothetical protein